MAATVFWIEGVGPGRLGIALRPRGDDWLEGDVREWAGLGVRTVVSLLQPAEERELGLALEASACRSAGLEHLSFPIPDCGVPDAFAELHLLAERLSHELGSGRDVVVHCRQGIGRSALVTSAVLIYGGVAPEEALHRVALARGADVPDTRDQREWLFDFARAGAPMRPYEPSEAPIPP